MTHVCSKCNKTYASYNSLWLHNKRFHSDNTKTHLKTSEICLKTSEICLKKSDNVLKKDDIQKNKYNCKKCDKKFNNRKSKWSHEQKCNSENKNDTIQNNQDMIVMQETIDMLKEEIRKIKENKGQSIINNNIVNNVMNIQYINSLNHENIKQIDKDDIINVLLSNEQAIFNLIKVIYMNQNIPENHIFCVTSLEGNYVKYVMNGKIISEDKKGFFDTVLHRSAQILIKFYDDLNFSVEYDPDPRNPFNHKKLIQNIYIQPHLKNIFYEQLNQMSYNNKDMILETWKMMTKQTKIVSSTPKNPNLLTNEDVFIKLPEIEEKQYIEIYNADLSLTQPQIVSTNDSNYVQEQKLNKKINKNTNKKVKEIIVK